MITRRAWGIFAKSTTAQENRVSLVTSDAELGQHVSDIVSAYVGNHHITALEVPALIRSVCDALTRLAAGAAEPEAPPPEPAVPIKKSVFPDYIICLEDGKKLKTLKRHLRNAYGMTPEDIGRNGASPTAIRWWPRAMRSVAPSSRKRMAWAAKRRAQPKTRKTPNKRHETRQPRSIKEP